MKSIRSLVAVLLAVAVGLGLGCSGSGDGAAPPGAGGRAVSPPAAGAELASCDVLPGGAPAGSPGQDDATDAAGGSVEPVEITVWYAEDDGFSALLAQLVDEFAAAHAGVDVRLDDLGSRGRAAVLDGWRATAPDNRPSLAIMPEDATRLLADSGQVVAPGDCLAEMVPGLTSEVEAAWSVRGVVQAVPFAVSTPVLVYNRRAFRDAGLDPGRPPATLDELRTAAERLVGRGTADSGLVLDTRADGTAGWLIEQWNAQARRLSVAPRNGWGTAAERAVWQDGPAIEYLAWLQSMVEDGLAASVGANTSGIDDLAALVGERPRAAMTLHTSAALAVMSDLADGGRLTNFELGVAPLPGPGPERGSLPGGAALWLAAGKPEAETRAAWSLAAFLASPAVQARWAAATGYTPVTEAAAELEPLGSTWARRPQLEVAYRALGQQATSPVALGMSAGPEREIKELLAVALGNVVRGEDPAAALEDAAADANRLLRAYNRGTGGALNG